MIFEQLLAACKQPKLHRSFFPEGNNSAGSYHTIETEGRVFVKVESCGTVEPILSASFVAFCLDLLGLVLAIERSYH